VLHGRVPTAVWAYVESVGKATPRARDTAELLFHILRLDGSLEDALVSLCILDIVLAGRFGEELVWQQAHKAPLLLAPRSPHRAAIARALADRGACFRPCAALLPSATASTVRLLRMHAYMTLHRDDGRAWLLSVLPQLLSLPLDSLFGILRVLLTEGLAPTDDGSGSAVATVAAVIAAIPATQRVQWCMSTEFSYTMRVLSTLAPWLSAVWVALARTHKPTLSAGILGALAAATYANFEPREFCDALASVRRVAAAEDWLHAPDAHGGVVVCFVTYLRCAGLRWWLPLINLIAEFRLTDLVRLRTLLDPLKPSEVATPDEAQRLACALRQAAWTRRSAALRLRSKAGPRVGTKRVRPAEWSKDGAVAVPGGARRAPGECPANAVGGAGCE
jgi:hypothetical protein